MTATASEPAATAPRDGRVIRGYFVRELGSVVVAAAWSAERSAWVDRQGVPVAEAWRLDAWGEQ